MADIFISYARKDRRHAEKLAKALEAQGWSVFWDVKIPAGGKFRDVIDEALEATKCVIVLWSKISVERDWVVSEADDGRRRGILIPVLINSQIRIPKPFDQIQTADLSEWDGTETDPVFVALVADVAGILGPPPKRRTKAEKKLFQPLETHLSSSEFPEMVVIPAGSFMMGSPENESGRFEVEGPQHEVDIPFDFALGKYPVTRAEYSAFAHETGREWPDPRFSQTDRHPVVNVSWKDAKAYVDWLSQKTDKEFRLPSEAEWEYAARAGTTTARYWGDSPSEEYARFYAKGSYGTAPVGDRKPNAFGLYDMLGNVSEWVEDCWNYYYKGAPTDGSSWMSGDCSEHVFRGGAWDTHIRWIRSAFRNHNSIVDRFHHIGFRVARTLPIRNLIRNLRA